MMSADEKLLVMQPPCRVVFATAQKPLWKHQFLVGSGKLFQLLHFFVRQGATAKASRCAQPNEDVAYVYKARKAWGCRLTVVLVGFHVLPRL